MTTKLQDLQYYLLPSANPPKDLLPIHNTAFKAWAETWGAVFTELNYDASLLVDDFIRQDIIACIFAGEEFVGAHLYSFFALDCDAARKFRYLEGNYPELYFQKLKKLNVHTVMSMEYLTVSPKWRGKDKAIHVSTTLVGLANRVRDEYQIDAAIAPARKDYKVPELAYAFGGECIIANTLNHNVLCDLLASVKGKTHPHENPNVRTAEEYLWENRIDLVKQTQLPKLKVA